MIASTPRRTLPLRLLLAVALLLLGSLHAAVTAQVSGTTWVVNGKAVLKLKGSPQVKGTQKVKGPALVRFLAGGDVDIEDATGTTMGGSWSEVGDALQITVDQDDIEDFLDDNLGALASQLQGLQVDGISSDATLVTKNGVGSLTYKLRFTLAFSVDGEPLTLDYKLTAKGQFDLSGGSSGGETFVVDGKQTFKNPKQPIKEQGALQLVLGPDGGLANARFSLHDGVGAELFGGWYTRVGKKIALLPDADDVEDYVEAWVAPTVQQLFPGGSVSLEALGSKLAGTVKKNGALKLKGKVKFFSVLDVGFDSDEFKSTYVISTSG